MLKHRVLVIGVGSIGERHARTFGQTGRCDVAICEPNAKLRDTIAQRYGVERAYGSLDEALGDGHDVAVICTPAQLHVSMASRIVSSGCHVLIEKPLSISTDGVEQLTELVAKHKRVAAVAYVWRNHPIVGAMKQAVDDGRFGKPMQFTIITGQHFPTFRPAYRDIYFTSHAAGGGAIQDALTHMINLAEWFVGPTDRLVCDADHLILEGVSVEDTVHLLTRHGKVMGSIALSLGQAPTQNVFNVHCERGSVQFDMEHNRWRSMSERNGTWHDETFDPIERDVLFVNQANVFLDAVEGNGQPACTLDQGVQTLRVNLAALKSAKESTWQTISR